MEFLDEYSTQLEGDIRSAFHEYDEKVRALLTTALDQNKRLTTLTEQMVRLQECVEQIQMQFASLPYTKPTTAAITAAVNLRDCIDGLIPSRVSTPVGTTPHASPIVNAQREIVVGGQELCGNKPYLVEAETETAEPEPDALLGELAEQVGGVEEESATAPSHGEDGDVNTEEGEEEEEAEEEVELELFPWKGKSYYKDTENQLYRSDGDGGVEDEPFALYDPVANRLTKILPK